MLYLLSTGCGIYRSLHMVTIIKGGALLCTGFVLTAAFMIRLQEAVKLLTESHKNGLGLESGLRPEN